MYAHTDRQNQIKSHTCTCMHAGIHLYGIDTFTCRTPLLLPDAIATRLRFDARPPLASASDNSTPSSSTACSFPFPWAVSFVLSLTPMRVGAYTHIHIHPYLHVYIPYLHSISLSFFLCHAHTLRLSLTLTARCRRLFFRAPRPDLLCSLFEIRSNTITYTITETTTACIST